MRKPAVEAGGKVRKGSARSVAENSKLQEKGIKVEEETR